MQHFIDIGQIEARAAAINLRMGRLARMAGVHPTTITRVRHGTDPRSGTVRKLLETLERAEARVFAHLKELDRNGGGRQSDMFNGGGTQ